MICERRHKQDKTILKLLFTKYELVLTLRLLSFVVVLFFMGIHPAWSLADDCSLENVDCRGPVIYPFFYDTGRGGRSSSAQGASENECNYWLTMQGSSLCTCDVTYVAQFQEGSYEGAGTQGDLYHRVSWSMGVETFQIFYATAPGARYKWISGLDCQSEDSPYSQVARNREVLCPVGYRQNYMTEPKYTYCFKILDKPIEDRSCRVGNPVFIGSGNKQQIESDYQSNTLRFVRTYNSDTTDVATGETIGKHWRHNYDRYLSIPPNATGSAYALRQNGVSNHFILEDGVTVEATMINDRIERTDTGWHYITRNDNTELYNNAGRLVSITNLSGHTQTFTYDNAGRLTEVRDDFGRTLTLAYDGEDRISTMTDPDGGLYGYEYDDSGNLSKVIYPDDTPDDMTDNQQRIYHYENSFFPNALTGITDENGNRFAAWNYDSEGRAILSEHAGSADRTTLSVNGDGSSTVTNSLGKQTTYHFADIKGYRYVASVEGHQTSYCAGTNKAYSYDANGNVISKTDWNGVTTTYTYDIGRNLELTRTESVGTPQERTITTEWHPQFRLPTKITEPKRITEYTYDAQGRQLSRKVSGIQ